MKNILQGDCREVLKNFEDGSVHLIITSPPYNVGMNYGKYQDNLSQEEYYKFAEEWLRESYRILVDGGRICINIPMYNYVGDFNMVMPYYEIMTKVGFIDRDIFIWVKLAGLKFAQKFRVYGNVSARNPQTQYPWELVIVMQKGKDSLDGDESDISYREFIDWMNTVWFIEPESRRKHPAPFPDEVPYRLIKLYSFVGQKVLDPFVGSGTTLRVSERLKRDGYGIELNPEYIQMAKRF